MKKSVKKSVKKPVVTRWDEGSLARFRADPALITVSIRRDSPDEMWCVTVTDRYGWMGSVSTRDKDPIQAVGRALQMAEAKKFPGIDLELQWTYDHPWKK